VEKVWKRSDQIGLKDFSVVIHGKRYHEETEATFSHANRSTAVVVVRDKAEAEQLADIIRGKLPSKKFFDVFRDRYSKGFDPDYDLKRIGVVNQTTMLATETAEIAQILRQAVADRHGEDRVAEHFADTSDTLCYATNENQNATRALVDSGADLAIVVGGTNSSNTSHLVEICAERMPTYFISEAEQILDVCQIEHFDLSTRDLIISEDWLGSDRPLEILLTAGASCPDAVLDEVMQKVAGLFDDARTAEQAIAEFQLGII
jgi:4-hydroxy-3-methylbut-2-enyl diphosphate reductase